MIKANARQEEQYLFEKSYNLQQLIFEDMTYEQSVKLRDELKKLSDKQKFYKQLIKQSDKLKEEDNNEQHFIK